MRSRNAAEINMVAPNLVPRVFSLFNMAAAREKTLGHSDLKRSLIGAILAWVLIGLRLPKKRWRIFMGSSWDQNIAISRSLWRERWTVFLFDNLQNCSRSVWRRSEVPNSRFVDDSLIIQVKTFPLLVIYVRTLPTANVQDTLECWNGSR